VGRTTGGMDAGQWRKQGLGALLLAFAMAALYFTTDIVQGLEWRLYDAGASGASRQPLAEVVIVAIDEPSLAALGPWPWPRDVHAQPIRHVQARLDVPDIRDGKEPANLHRDRTQRVGLEVG